MSDVRMELTHAGQRLHAKIQAGLGDIALKITRVATGSGISDDPHNQTSVIDQRQNVAIVSQRVFGQHRAEITTLISNQEQPNGEPAVNEGYSLTQIGIYADDPDEGEILYRISQFTRPNYVPAFTEIAFTLEQKWNFTVENAHDAVIQVDLVGLATIGVVQQMLEVHNQDLNAHPNLLSVIADLTKRVEALENRTCCNCSSSQDENEKQANDTQRIYTGYTKTGEAINTGLIRNTTTNQISPMKIRIKE